MRYKPVSWILMWVFVAVAPAMAQPLDAGKATLSDDGKIAWYNALELGVENQGWKDVAKPYDRLPASAEGVVPDDVWGLSRHSAGLCIRFVSNSSTISAKWSLRDGDLAMNHMPATGVSGVDLYAKKDGRWGWVGVGRPKQQNDNEGRLFGGAPEGMTEYRLYLPLYNGVESLLVGIDPGATIAKAPAFPESHAKPMLFWGTSILQGGCASRPGMSYPEIIARRMERPHINLGFSGNGKMDPEVTALIAKLDVSVYVIDCLPNMKADLVTERTEPTVRALREAHPETPIVLVENIVYQQSWISDALKKGHQEKNVALKAAYDRLMAAGVKNLYYIPGDNLLGHDSEATVDGTHPTDLGFLRMADEIEPMLRKILE